MTPNEVLTLQALKLKSDNDSYNPKTVDLFLNADAEETKQHYRNLCAMIPVELFDEFERFSHLLDLSKRELLTLAVEEIIIKTRNVFDQVKPFENQDKKAS